MRHPRRRWAVPVTLMTVVALAGCGSGGGDQPAAGPSGTQTLKLGSSFKNLSSSLLAAGVQQGFFTKHGVNLDITSLNGNTPTITATIAGDVDMAFTGPSAVVNAAEGGSTDLRIIGNVVNKMAFEFITTPDINQPTDLQGKKCMVSSKGSTSDVVVRFVLQQLGVDVGKVTILTGGDEPARLAAVETGQVNCTVENIGQVDLSSPKIKVLKHVYEYNQDLPQAAFVAKEGWLASHQDLATNFMKGFTETLVWAKNPANLDTLTGVGAAQLGVSATVLKPGFQTYTTSIWPTYPAANDSGMDFLLKTSGAKTTNADALFDNSIVQTLQDAKFAEGLKN